MRGIVESIGIITLLFLTACKKELTEVPGGNEYSFLVPSHFPEPYYQFENNEVSQEGFILGRKLFYDKRLSLDNTVSCASCHIREYAFSDPGKKVSTGVEGRVGVRNSPALFNLAWNPSFMWDGGINHIEIMPLAPVTDHNEMDMNMQDLMSKLDTLEEYSLLLQSAFGTREMNDQRFFYALTQFLTLLVSSESKYDRFLEGKVQLTDEELEGKHLFEQNCAVCHAGVLFTDYSYRNNGLLLDPEDNGRERISLNSEDRGKFKVPSLRNSVLTYPYMHDGRFETLEEVIDHYRFGINLTATTDPTMVNGISLSEEEKAKLIIFLSTLTDAEFCYNPVFGNPFGE